MLKNRADKQARMTIFYFLFVGFIIDDQISRNSKKKTATKLTTQQNKKNTLLTELYILGYCTTGNSNVKISSVSSILHHYVKQDQVFSSYRIIHCMLRSMCWGQPRHSCCVFVDVRRTNSNPPEYSSTQVFQEMSAWFVEWRTRATPNICIGSMWFVEWHTRATPNICIRCVCVNTQQGGSVQWCGGIHHQCCCETFNQTIKCHD